MTLSPQTTLQGGKYRIEATLGQGGFGITYLAEQVALGRRVAIKEFFMKDLCNRDSDTSHVTIPSIGSHEMVERFRTKFVKEAQTIAQFNNPHIVRIHDIFEENGTAYYVMEYHDGGSLADLVKSNGHLSEEKAVGYARQIADALGYLHARKINHLDVKPANVLLNEDGDAVLIDFGLAKHYDSEGNQTSTTPVGISHGYAPMEQYRRGGVGTFSPTSDIYSLGATLYKMLTGITPPEASDVNDEGLPPMTVDVSPAVRNAVEQAMQPRRKDRPQSIGEFLALLNGETPVVGVVDDEKTNVVIEEKTTIEPESTKTVEKTTVPPTPKPTPKSKYAEEPKSRKGLIIGVICALLVIAVGTLFLLNREEAPTPTEEAPAPIKKAPAPERQGWYKFPLYGDVSKVTCKYNGEIKEIYYFNVNGDVSKHVDYSSGNSRETYRYDSAGNLIEEVWDNSSGKLRARVTYRYDSAGNMIEKAHYDSDGKLRVKHTYRYDYAGNMIEWMQYISSGELDLRATYRYDSAGNQIEEAKYNSDGELYKRETYRYDSAGNQIEWLEYNSLGELKDRVTSRYDSAGNLIEKVGYNSDGELWGRETYRYDSAGNQIEEAHYNSDGELERRFTYRYDSARNQIEYEYNSDGELRKYTYEIEYR